MGRCAGNYTCEKDDNFIYDDGRPIWKGRMCSVVAETYFPIAGNLWSCPTTEEGRWTQAALLFLVLMGTWIYFNTFLLIE